MDLTVFLESCFHVCVDSLSEKSSNTLLNQLNQLFPPWHGFSAHLQQAEHFKLVRFDCGDTNVTLN